MKIAITTTTDRAYLPAACCQLKSTADFLPSNAAADLFLVCCNVSTQDVADVNRFFAKCNLEVKIIIPKEIVASIQPINNRWPLAAYLRLHFDSNLRPRV